MLTLVIGGARSGKSKFAQSLCPGEARVAYVATARGDDEEMRARIAHHRARRPAEWLVIEEPLALASAVCRAAEAAEFVLVDCLTIWLANLWWEHRDCPPAEIERLAFEQIDAVSAAAAGGAVILVTNEVGGGIVPDTAVGRGFRDLQGLLNQRAAAAADRVFLTVAGIPLQIKPGSRVEAAL